MSRWVNPQRAGLVAATGDPPDGPAGRLVKYVPAEIISAFTLLYSALASMKLDSPTARYAATGLIVLFLIVTVAYIALRVPPGPVRNAHLLVSPVAYLAWSYAIAGSLLGPWFIALVSFFAQAVFIALSLLVAPHE